MTEPRMCCTEINVHAEYIVHAGERATRDYPGSPPNIEILRVVCDGSDIKNYLTDATLDVIEADIWSDLSEGGK